MARNVKMNRTRHGHYWLSSDQISSAGSKRLRRFLTVVRACPPDAPRSRSRSLPLRSTIASRTSSSVALRTRLVTSHLAPVPSIRCRRFPRGFRVVACHGTLRLMMVVQHFPRLSAVEPTSVAISSLTSSPLQAESLGTTRREEGDLSEGSSRSVGATGRDSWVAGYSLGQSLVIPAPAIGSAD